MGRTNCGHYFSLFKTRWPLYLKARSRLVSSQATMTTLRILKAVADRDVVAVTKECEGRIQSSEVIGLLKNDPQGLDFFLRYFGQDPGADLHFFTGIVDNQTFDVCKRHNVLPLSLHRCRWNVTLKQWQYMQSIGYIPIDAPEEKDSDLGADDKGEEDTDENDYIDTYAESDIIVDSNEAKNDVSSDEDSGDNVDNGNIVGDLRGVVYSSIDELTMKINTRTAESRQADKEMRAEREMQYKLESAIIDHIAIGRVMCGDPEDGKFLHEHNTPFMTAWVQVGVNPLERTSPDEPVKYCSKWALIFTFRQADSLTRVAISDPYNATREDWRKFETGDIRMIFSTQTHRHCILEAIDDKYTFASGISSINLNYSIMRKNLQPAITAALADVDRLGLPFAKSTEEQISI